MGTFRMVYRFKLSKIKAFPLLKSTNVEKYGQIQWNSRKQNSQNYFLEMPLAKSCNAQLKSILLLVCCCTYTTKNRRVSKSHGKMAQMQPSSGGTTAYQLSALSVWLSSGQTFLHHSNTLISIDV